MLPPSSTVVLHVLNALIGILSIAVLALAAYSVILTDSFGDAYPKDTKDTGLSMLFWPGVGGIVDMCLFIFLWFMTPSVGGLVCTTLVNATNKADTAQTKKRKAYWNGLLFVASFIFGRPLIVLIYAFVEWNKASRSQLSPSNSHITPELWACASADEVDVRDTGTLCSQLHAARYMLIPVVALGAIMLALVVWLRIRLIKEEGCVTGSKPQGVHV
jgi:hypothetical protein